MCDPTFRDFAFHHKNCEIPVSKAAQFSTVGIFRLPNVSPKVSECANSSAAAEKASPKMLQTSRGQHQLPTCNRLNTHGQVQTKAGIDKQMVKTVTAILFLSSESIIVFLSGTTFSVESNKPASAGAISGSRSASAGAVVAAGGTTKGVRSELHLPPDQTSMASSSAICTVVRCVSRSEILGGLSKSEYFLFVLQVQRLHKHTEVTFELG